MTLTATLTTEPLTLAAQLELMATPVLMVEWIVKQQQLLKQQQRLIEEQRRLLETLQKENEELKDAVDKLKNRSSQNSSVPPSSDHLKKPSDKSKRNKGKKSVQLSPAGPRRESLHRGQSTTIRARHAMGLVNQIR